MFRYYLASMVRLSSFFSGMTKIYLAVNLGSVPVEFMFSTAGNMLNSRSSMALYQVDLVLFMHDNYDVVC